MIMHETVGIIDCGMGNVGSVEHSLALTGLHAVRVQNPAQLSNIKRLVLPGVGSFSAFISRLHSSGLGSEIVNFTKCKDNRLIGICVGMQALLTAGSEGDGAKGLDLIKGRVVKFDDSLVPRIPHVGWNDVKFLSSQLFDHCGKYYFTHSYHCKLEERNNILALTDNGTKFVSAFRHENILGFQFHPEKSGEIGSKLLQYFLTEAM